MEWAFFIFTKKCPLTYGKSWRVGNASRNETNEILTIYILGKLWVLYPEDGSG